LAKKNNFFPVILAGGRGTRFWPLSRKRRAKQLLALDGNQTMIQQTVSRLQLLADKKSFWIVTNGDLHSAIARQLPSVPKKQILAEPVGRNTAPAIGLAAFLLLRFHPEAVLGLFPSDHVIADQVRYREAIKRGIKIAASGENIVVLGIRPTRAETGYGYIESGAADGDQVLHVRRFTEKPDAERAAEFVKAGNFYWNSGMFLWSAHTLVNALVEHLPDTAKLLEEIAAAFGTTRFDAKFRKLYPQCQNISIDYALLEPRSAKGEHASNIYCIPADFGWNDLGSWAALHEHRSARMPREDGNMISSDGSFVLNSQGNYVHAPGKFVATVGVNDLVVVETEDALLITTRERSQDVGKVVKYLDEKQLERLV
jgi:mannose-1-phosphate guanylyltransferase